MKASQHEAYHTETHQQTTKITMHRTFTTYKYTDPHRQNN